MPMINNEDIIYKLFNIQLVFVCNLLKGFQNFKQILTFDIPFSLLFKSRKYFLISALLTAICSLFTCCTRELAEFTCYN